LVLGGATIVNTYFSKTEREMFLKLDLLLGTAQTIIDAYEATPSPDKKFMKDLRTGRTYLAKALTRRYIGLEPKEMQRARKMVKNYRVLLLPSDIAKANNKKLQEEMETIVMSADDFKDWYCDAIPYTCGKCPYHGSEIKQGKCRMRKFMEKYDIVPVNTHAEGNICEYDYLAAGIDLDEMERKINSGELTVEEVQTDIVDAVERVV
jgi:hypothetical protein